MPYLELSVEERAIIQIGQARDFSRRWLASLLKRAPSTICREICRNRVNGHDYSAHVAQQQLSVVVCLIDLPAKAEPSILLKASIAAASKKLR